MKIYRLLFLVAAALAGSVNLHGQVFDWAQQARQLGTRPSNTISAGAGATDAAGNTYAVIELRDSVRIGNQTFQPSAGGQVLACRSVFPP